MVRMTKAVNSAAKTLSACICNVQSNTDRVDKESHTQTYGVCVCECKIIEPI